MSRTPIKQPGRAIFPEAENPRQLLPISQTAFVEERFNILKDAWKKDVSESSSMEFMALHPSYQQIIGMAVIPYIIEELKTDIDHWFWALCFITGENPVQEKNIGNLDLMAQDWIKWNEKKTKER